MPTHHEPETPSISDTDPEYESALATMRPRLMAMPDDALQWQASLDASTAADAVEAAAVRLVPYRAALVAQFGETAGTLVNELPLVARAAKQAHIELSRALPVGDASPLHKEVSAAYQLLMTDAQSLANRGLLDPQKLERARDIKGYQPLLQSVLVLVAVLREAWPQVQGHTPLTVADIDRAARVARKMTTTLAHRDFGSSRMPEAELRTRALSMLIDRYDDVRRMMTFIRWHQDDVDSIVPSLWATRSRRPRTDSPVLNDEPGASPTRPAPSPAPSPAADPAAPGGPFTS